jgi:hypothetical protein
VDQARLASAPPAGTRLPVEASRTFPRAALQAAFERHGPNLTPYRLSSSDFDVAFITPLMVYAAQQPDKRTTSNDMRPTAIDQMRIPPWDAFGNWSEYVSAVPPVLLIRVTPKLAESFWSTVARGAAMTQGMSVPSIKRFKAALTRMRVSCGDQEVAPVHTFVLESSVVQGESVTEGLYAFDPGAIGPQCGTVTLALYSARQPDRADTKTVDGAIVRQLWQDLEPGREP